MRTVKKEHTQYIRLEHPYSEFLIKTINGVPNVEILRIKDKIDGEIQFIEEVLVV